MTREADQWLRVATVCRRLDVHPRTVYRWIESGRLRVGEDARQLPGGHWRIRATALSGAVYRQPDPCPDQP